MIKTEELIINSKNFIRTYSDAGFKIHGGVPEADYDEATDPAEFNRQYTETNIPIEAQIDTTLADKAEAYDILMGVSE